jgi:hypothetical protein
METIRINASVLSETGVCTTNMVTRSESPSVPDSLEGNICSTVMETTAPKRTSFRHPARVPYIPKK